jgi:hypothetical protein
VDEDEKWFPSYVSRCATFYSPEMLLAVDEDEKWFPSFVLRCATCFLLKD